MCESSTITTTSAVRVKIIENWLEGKGSVQIGKEPQPQNLTIANNVDIFGHRGNLEAEKKGNRACLDGSAHREYSAHKEYS